ncbi:hypothetical protein OOT46_21210 [Aquabacterium sp. A7-Y]|uniref:hypothetical protein n=1 Tax=Aquabacterium sp. A7-Y TaxID=1349605 RepID=UPI00223CF20A|nr:hypothetical protein [Aquabacterium sp. A7-Y]MCW7540356.1 hypothetical protein [Aquabacterium sp. A7-Y]
MQRKPLILLVSTLALSACSSVGVGLSVPVGFGNVGVSIGSGGRIGGSVGVGRGGVGVGIGGSTRLPASGDGAAPASQFEPLEGAASAPVSP